MCVIIFISLNFIKQTKLTARTPCHTWRPFWTRLSRSSWIALSRDTPVWPGPVTQALTSQMQTSGDLLGSVKKTFLMFEKMSRI